MVELFLFPVHHMGRGGIKKGAFPLHMMSMCCLDTCSAL